MLDANYIRIRKIHKLQNANNIKTNIFAFWAYKTKKKTSLDAAILLHRNMKSTWNSTMLQSQKSMHVNSMPMKEKKPALDAGKSLYRNLICTWNSVMLWSLNRIYMCFVPMFKKNTLEAPISLYKNLKFNGIRKFHNHYKLIITHLILLVMKKASSYVSLRYTIPNEQ